MHHSFNNLIPLATAALLCGAWTAAGAQQSSPIGTEADAALATCSRAAQADRKAEAKAAADRAEQLFQQELDSRPVDARAGLARVISECRIPFANFMSAGRLVGKSSKLLEEALEMDPTHWSARYTLALNHFYTPEFLGRTDDAIRHLEILLEQQGARNDAPHLAGTYLYLGDLYKRVGREEDAAALWQHGLALFPDNAALQKRLAAEVATSGK